MGQGVGKNLTMQYNGIITRKIETLNTLLAEIESVVPVTEEQLRGDWKLRRSMERDLQVMIEIVIDICNRIISLKKLSPQTTSRGSIDKCIELKIISPSDKYIDMIGFRNFIVHRYENIDLGILSKTVNECLPVFYKLRAEILAHTV